MLRILHILSADLPSGTAKQLAMLLEQLDGRACSCLYDLERNQTRLRRHSAWNAERVQGSTSSVHSPAFWFGLAKQLRQFRPDVVHTWGRSAAAATRVTRRLRPLLRKPARTLTSVRSMAELDRLGRSRNAFTDAKDRLVVNSPALLQALGEHDQPGGDSCGHALIPNALPESTASSAADQPAPGWLHQRLNVPAETRFIVAMGDLRPHKRLQDLIWGLDLLRVIRPELHLLILGAGDQHDRWAAYSDDVHLDRCVHFLGWQPDARPYLRESFCCWLASDDEGESNTILEAQSAGVPVVAADLPSHHHLIDNGTTGLLVPLGDCAEFARKTNLLLQDSDLSERIAEQAAAQHFGERSPESVADQYYSLYAGEPSVT